MQEQQDNWAQLRLFRAAYSETCERYEASIYTCALAESQGRDLDDYRDVLEHIGHCDRCTETYREVKSLLALEASGEWVEPQEIPFWSPVSREEIETSIEGPNRQPRVGDQGIQAWLDRQGQALARLVVDLSNLFEPRPQIQWRSKTPVQPGEPRHELLISMADSPSISEVNLHISTLADDTQSDHYTLRVGVTIAERWPDFSGAIVTLLLPGGQKRTQLTGQNGLAQFLALTQDEITRSMLEIKLPNP
jgi:hypothetical protein